jgi:hypothetical protein
VRGIKKQEKSEKDKRENIKRVKDWKELEWNLNSSEGYRAGM